MIALCPLIVHPVQTDFAHARLFPWRSQCTSSPRSIHLTLGWLYRFSTTPDAMVVRDSHENQDFTEIDSGHVMANLSRYSPVYGLSSCQEAASVVWRHALPWTKNTIAHLEKLWKSSQSKRECSGFIPQAPTTHSAPHD